MHSSEVAKSRQLLSVEVIEAHNDTNIESRTTTSASVVGLHIKPSVSPDLLVCGKNNCRRKKEHTTLYEVGVHF